MQYNAPNWTNNASPAVNAANLQAMSDTLQKDGVEIAALQTQLASPFNFKGTVADVGDLPSGSNTVNDTYYVTAAKCLYTWNGSAWSQSSISESDYLTSLSSLGLFDRNLLGATLNVQDTSPYILTTSLWTWGAGISNTGANQANTSACRTSYISVTKPSRYRLTDSNYTFNVWCYSSQNVSDALFPAKPDYDTNDLIITPTNGTKYFRMCVKKADGTTFTTDPTDPTNDAYKVLHALERYHLADSTLSEADKPADAKETGDKIAAVQNSLGYNAEPVYAPSNNVSETTEDGITYKISGGLITMSGTATAALTINISGTQYAIPNWMQEGTQYYLNVDSTGTDLPNVRIRKYPAATNIYNSPFSGAFNTGSFTGVNGVILSYYIPNGYTVNCTMKISVLTAPANWTVYDEARGANAAGKTLRVMQYNIGDYVWGKDPTAYPLTEAQYAEVLPNYKKLFGTCLPDLLCIEEFNQKFYVTDGNTVTQYPALDVLFSPIFPNKSIKSASTHTSAVFTTVKNVSWTSPFVYGLYGQYNRWRFGFFSLSSGINALVCCGYLDPTPNGYTPSQGMEIKESEVNSLFTIIEGYNADAVIVCADFNCTRTHAYQGPYSSVEALYPDTTGVTAGSAYDYDALIKIAEFYGYTAGNAEFWGVESTRIPNSGSSPLDNIMVKGKAKIRNFQVLTVEYDNLSSDHIPVIADVYIG